VCASIHVVHPSGNARSQKSITLPPPDDDRSARTYSLTSHPVFVSHSRTLHKPPCYPFSLHRTVRRTTTLTITLHTHTHIHVYTVMPLPPFNPPPYHNFRAKDKRPHTSTHTSVTFFRRTSR